MGDDSATWVYDDEEIEHARETGYCPCGGCSQEDCFCDFSEGELTSMGRFGSFYWCGNCRRRFAADGTDIVHPDTVLQTDLDGVIPYDRTHQEAMHLLVEMSDVVVDYIEFSPTDQGDVYLYAAEGLFMGCLIYDRRVGNPCLRSLVIAAGHRGEGHGREFVESWFQQEDDEVLNVLAAKESKGFYEALDIPLA